MAKESPRSMPEKPPHYEMYSGYEGADIVMKMEKKRGPQITLDHWQDTKNPEKIKKDYEKLQKRLLQFREEEERMDSIERARKFKQKKISDAFETTIVAHGEERNWLGSNVLTNKTTEYDDVINGVDAVAEFNAPHASKEHPRLALAIDATTDQNYTTIEKKMKNNIEKVLGINGKLARVEYFESQITHERRELVHVVPLVLGLENRHAEEIIVDFANFLTFQQLRSGADKDLYKDDINIMHQRFAKHPAQRVFLKEMQTQLELYQDILEEKNDPQSTAYKEKITDLQIILTSIEKEKDDIDIGELSHDAVLALIQDMPAQLKKDYS